MSFNPLKWIRGWRLDKFFHNFKDNAAKVAVSITEQVKTLSEGELVQGIAAILDQALKSHVASDVLNIIHSATLTALSVELAITALPDNPTQADILAWEQNVYKAIAGKDPYGKSKLWTTFASQVYGIIQAQTQQPGTLTYAKVIEEIEKAYQLYLQDKADSETDDPN